MKGMLAEALLRRWRARSRIAGNRLHPFSMVANPVVRNIDADVVNAHT
ncbi:MAG: hypothetical protein ACLFQ1_07895 [Halochromatium sp.]